MAKNITKRNEDAPFYFEKLLAAIDFLDLLDAKGLISRLQIKPDRKHGPSRRIEDLTRFYKNGGVEVVQMKHTLVSTTPLGFSDLWIASVHPSKKKTGRKEGTNIFKFLKSWRIHRKTTSLVTLTLVSNKRPNTNLSSFFKDIVSLRKNKNKWKSFSEKYKTEIQNIKTNCSQKPFTTDKELREFISALSYSHVAKIDDLEKELEEKLRGQGIAEKVRVHAFINRVTKKFVSDDVDILPSDVVALIDRIKTGLLQEIAAPLNYIQRPDLEKKILAAIESKKEEGGFVLLFSPSGSGKTVLLSRLAEKNPDFFPYFCRIRPFEAIRTKTGYSNANRLSSTWFKADIIQRCYEFGLLPTSVSVTDNEDFIDKTFDESLSILGQKAQERTGKKIVIIVDALDQVETDKFKGKSVLDAIPAVKQPGVVFLLSTWGDKYLPPSIKNLPQSTKKDARIDLFFTEKEIIEYFKQVKISLTQDQISIIKKKTKGLAISIFYLAQKLKGQTGVDRIINSPGQYDEVFEWYRPIWNSLATKDQECLGYLCFHFAKAKREDLRRTVKSKLSVSEFDKLLMTIAPFIDTTGAFIEPYHDSFRRFVISHLSKDKAFYHRNLAEYYSNNLSGSYGKKYIIKHLETAGLKDVVAKRVYRKLDANDFFATVLKSNLDDPTKVEIGKSFVNYFYAVKEIKKFLKYSILSSNIYPTVYDEHTYKKAYIGTEKLVAEVESELLLPKRQHIRDQRDWVFKRLAIGNILKTKTDKNSLNLASRFLDDSLFRINLNPQLLWEEDAMREFWNHAEEISEAYVNTGQYIRALAFLKRGISFKKKTKKTEGLLASKVAKVHLQNLKIDKKSTLSRVAKSTKAERLFFYLTLQRSNEKIPDMRDFKELLKDERMEAYMYEEKNDRYYVDLAKAILVYNIKNKNNRVEKILKNLKIEIPYFSRGYTYWGDMEGGGRHTFLNWTALKLFVDKGFKLETFYPDALKERFKNRSDLSEHENPAFIEVLLLQQVFHRNAILVQMGKMKWKEFWEPFKLALEKYKEKVDQIKQSTHQYGYDLQKTCYPYYYDLSGMIEENLEIVDIFFPTKLLLVVSKIEDIFGADYLYKDPGLLETLIRVPSEDGVPKLKDKIDVYFEKLLELRQKEALDNLAKSSNLQDIATLAAKKKRLVLAEDVYIQSLKYSRGLWSKGDLRFSNFVDSLRTQKIDQFEFVLRCIEKVSDVVEGGWYWRIDFLESATYFDYKLALDYAYDFIIKGEVNPNEALVRIISTHVKNSAYDSLGEILPIVPLINFRDERGHELYENVSRIFYALTKVALNNGDDKTAVRLVSEYFEAAKRDLHPRARMNILSGFIKFADSYTALNKIKREFQKHIDNLEKEGYQPGAKSSSEYEVNYDGIDLKKLTACAKKDQVDAVIRIIDAYVKKPGYFTDRLFAGIVPFLSTTSIEKVRVWARGKNVDIEGSALFIALIKKALADNNQTFLRKVCSEIVKFQSTVEHFHSSHLIKDLNEVQFPGKRALIRKLLLISIRNYTGDGYSLPSVFSYSSDAIDDNYIELKQWSYIVWKEVVEKSMRLSLTK